MRAFIVISLSPQPADLEERIVTVFSGHNLKVAPNIWAVAKDAGTTKEVADTLGITPDAVTGAGVIVAIDAYFGHARKDIWDWLYQRMGGGVGG